MLKVFIGYDERQIVSFTTPVTSIYQFAKSPVMVCPLILDTLPISRRGLTPFTFSRFLTPWLADFKGLAVFMDADMLLREDISQLAYEVDSSKAVSVVRSLEAYEQTSFCLFNCEHPANRVLTPEFVQEAQINFHFLEWLEENQIGSLNPKWNQLVGYQTINSNEGNLHYTMGVPSFVETSTSDGAQTWQGVARQAMSAIPWSEIMGPSVHAIDINGVKLPKYVWDFERNQPKAQHAELVKSLVFKSKENTKASGSK